MLCGTQGRKDLSCAAQVARRWRDVALVPAVDGAALASAAGAPPRDVDAVGRALGCVVYAGWAVCGDADLARVGCDSWDAYERLFETATWAPKCVRGRVGKG